MTKPKKKATPRKSSGSSSTSRSAKSARRKNYGHSKAWLLERTVDLTASKQITWTPKKANPRPRLLKACALFEFIENELWISTKHPMEYVDRKGNNRRGQLVPFRFNAVQMILAQDLAVAWNAGKPWRRLVPKARQMGISTFTQGIFYGLSLGQAQYRSALIAHHDDGAQEIFSTAQTFEKHLDPDVSMDLETRQGGKLGWVNGSTMWIGSVKTGDALGKGPRLSGIHFSECANFADKGIDAVATATSIQNALSADHPDAIILYESTANGRDAFFHAEVLRALDPKARTENQVMFLPWFLEPTYRMSWTQYCARLEGRDLPPKFIATEEERLLRRELARVRVTSKNYRYRYNVELTDDQLIWRRFKIANDCYDKRHLFSRYYPSTLEEAFTATVTCLFSADTINHYARGAKKASAVGNPMELGRGVQFAYAKDGWTRLWAHPIPGEEYVIGADVGGERKGADPCAAYVVNKHTLEVVAAVHGYLEYDEYGEYLCLLGKYYNRALLVIENNYNPAVAKVAFKADYPNLYHYLDEASIKARMKPKPGFNTNRKTRPEIVLYLDKVTRDRSLKNPDRHFAKEMEDFVWSERAKHHQAGSGRHDDRLMAMALLLYCCPSVSDANVEVVPTTDENWAYSLWLTLRDDEDHEVVGKVLVL